MIRIFDNLYDSVYALYLCCFVLFCVVAALDANKDTCNTTFLLRNTILIVATALIATVLMLNLLTK